MDSWKIRENENERRLSQQHWGLAHYRWPNAYFAEQGLCSMEAAHVRLRQSVAR